MDPIYYSIGEIGKRIFSKLKLVMFVFYKYLNETNLVVIVLMSVEKNYDIF